MKNSSGYYNVVLPTHILEMTTYAAMRNVEKERGGNTYLIREVDVVERRRLRQLIIAYITIFSAAGTEYDIKRVGAEIALESITGVPSRTCLRYLQALIAEGLVQVPTATCGKNKGYPVIKCVTNGFFIDWLCGLTRKHADMETVFVDGKLQKNYRSVVYRAYFSIWKGRKRFKNCIRQDYSSIKPSAYNLNSFVDYETVSMARIPFVRGTKKGDILAALALNVMVEADIERVNGTNIIRKAFERELSVSPEQVNEAIGACLEVLGADYRGQVIDSSINLGEEDFIAKYGHIIGDDELRQVYVKKPMAKKVYVYGLSSFNESQVESRTYMSAMTLAKKMGLSSKKSGSNYRRQVQESGMVEIIAHEIPVNVPQMSYSEASKKFKLGIPSKQAFAYVSDKGVISVRKFNGVLLAKKADDDMSKVKLMFQTCSSLVPSEQSYSFVSVVPESKTVSLVDDLVSSIANEVSFRYTIDETQNLLFHSK